MEILKFLTFLLSTIICIIVIFKIYKYVENRKKKLRLQIYLKMRDILIENKKMYIIYGICHFGFCSFLRLVNDKKFKHIAQLKELYDHKPKDLAFGLEYWFHYADFGKRLEIINKCIDKLNKDLKI